MVDFSPLAPPERQPLYIQAIEALEALIKSGKITPGEKLPSEGVLAEKLGISRSTLREALGHLETHGLISRRQGIGTFVTQPYSPGFLGGLERLEPFREVAARAGVISKVVERSVDLSPASEKTAQILGIEEGEELIRVQIVEAVDGSPCMYVESLISPQVCSIEDLRNFKGSEIEFLLQCAEPALSHSRSEILSEGAAGQVAEKLYVKRGTPLLKLIETYFSATGITLGIAFVHFLTDYFHFYINRRAVGSWTDNQHRFTAEEHDE